jgi:imidazolonepropionase
LLYKNATLATLDGNRPYGLVEKGAVWVRDDGIIGWVGEENALPNDLAKVQSIDLDGRLITPGLIDCHTHLVFGGNRAREFELRLQGASYEEIAKAGGGIVSTVTATRAASEETLLEDALTRIDSLLAEGVTCIEIKSGYGLDLETELKMLRVARRIASERPVRIQTSFLGAHALPSEFKTRADHYIDEICIPTLHAAHKEGLVDAVDGFCENIAFSKEQIGRVFAAAKELNIPVKLHAEQLSHQGGTALAASYGALSVDHVEYTIADDVIAMAGSGSVAVLLPGAFYALKETQKPPVNLFRDYNVPMALATDCNPGSSPVHSLLLIMNMGCTLFGLTPEEALRATTFNAAKALGLKKTGKLIQDWQGDLAIWDVRDPAELSYRIGFNPLFMRHFGGH